MTILGEFSIVLVILLISQSLQTYFKLPIPATIIGMLILLLSLLLGIIKSSWIKKISNILIRNLPILFIPAGVGIINELNFLKGNIMALMVTLILTTVIVIITTGYTVQYLIKVKRGE